MHSKTLLTSACLICLILMAGCTTLSDFKKMSREQRAEAVCKKQPIFQDLAQRRAALLSQVADAKAALSAGYRVHTQCRTVKVYGNATASCSTFGGSTNCIESRPESYENQCTETPVSINPELERDNISRWVAEAESIKSDGLEKAKLCYQAVYRMSAEEAYKHYRN